jgi:hypothetical protein
MPTVNKKTQEPRDTRPPENGRSSPVRGDSAVRPDTRENSRVTAAADYQEAKNPPVRRDRQPTERDGSSSVRGAVPQSGAADARQAPQDDAAPMKKSPAPQETRGAEAYKNSRSAVSPPSFRGLPQERRAGAASGDVGFFVRLLNLEPHKKRWHKRRFVPNTYKNSILVKRIGIAALVIAVLFFLLVLFLFVFLRKYLKETDDGIRIVVPWLMSALRRLK